MRLPRKPNDIIVDDIEWLDFLNKQKVKDAEVKMNAVEFAYKAERSMREDKAKNLDRPITRLHTQAYADGGKAQLTNANISLFNLLKPIIIGFLFILFIIGPGISALQVILGSMSWYLWVGVILLVVYIYKYR